MLLRASTTSRPAFAAACLGATTVQPGRFNPGGTVGGGVFPRHGYHRAVDVSRHFRWWVTRRLFDGRRAHPCSDDLADHPWPRSLSDIGLTTRPKAGPDTMPLHPQDRPWRSAGCRRPNGEVRLIGQGLSSPQIEARGDAAIREASGEVGRTGACGFRDCPRPMSRRPRSASCPRAISMISALLKPRCGASPRRRKPHSRISS